MANFNIRAYERSAAKPPHLCAVPGCDQRRYRTNRICYTHLRQRVAESKAPRAMTERERWLESYAQKDGFGDFLLIWHEGADGYTGFEVILPDAGRMAVIGTIGGE